MPDRIRTRELAAEFIRKGDPLGWFEALYQEAERGDGTVPWADQEPNARLIEFWKAHSLETAGKRALVVGSGFGDDAEQLAAWGFKTTGFDISKTAIEATRKRYPETRVEYVVADLFQPPAGWLRAFDFVLEIYTVQALPANLRPGAIEKIAQFVAPGGRLLAIARCRAEDEPEGQGPPWPVTREELDGFRRAGLEEESFEDYAEPEPPWVRRFRALYRRP
jgi:SAM-dependent methyltransferase